jgi:hypothetical protein
MGKITGQDDTISAVLALASGIAGAAAALTTSTS